MNTYEIIILVLNGLVLTYTIFMIIYLSNAKKCDKYMSKSDVRFRKVAYIISWVQAVLGGLAILGILIAMLAGWDKGTKYSKVGFW